MSVRCAVTAFALFACAHSAQAHGIAGNRFFVGTLTFDDPSVADEAIVPNFSTLSHPVREAMPSITVSIGPSRGC
jgi:hypothetical protein